MKHRLKIIKIIITVLLVLPVSFTVLSTAQESQAAAKESEESRKEAMGKFRAAKKFIYSKEWAKAAAEFEKFVTVFSESKYADDSFYWLGYSLNKMSRDLSNVEKSLEIRKKALEHLSQLIARYPSSKWHDDATRLMVEISGELAAKGLKGFDKVILDSIRDAREAETKIIALLQLFDMDKEKAFSIAEKFIRNDKNTKLREKVIFALGQLEDPRVVSILVEVAEKDKDKGIRENAVYSLGHMGTPESFTQLLKLYNAATDIEVKKGLLFAISHSGQEAAVKELIRIYKKEKNRELKKQIIFALGSGDSKEAKEFILEILE